MHEDNFPCRKHLNWDACVHSNLHGLHLSLKALWKRVKSVDTFNK